MNRRDALAALGSLGLLSLSGGAGDAMAADTEVQSDRRRSDPGGPTMQTIGVLGGLGPQATMDFEVRVHHAAQRLIPPFQNRGYPPMVVYYCRHAPILLNEDYSPRLPIQPDPRLLDAARSLGRLADFLVIPSNTPHLLQRQIERASGRRILSMVHAAIEEAERREWRRIGVVGFGDPIVYRQLLEPRKIAYETVDGPVRAALDESVRKVMEGRDDAESSKSALDAVEALRAKGVDGIILGCTEIPLLLGEHANQADLLNPAQLLAEAAVKHALAPR